MEGFLEFILRFFLGGEIFNWIGGTLRWALGSVVSKVFNGPKFTYAEYLHGPKKPSNDFDESGHRFVNILIAFLAMGITLAALI